ncbi:tumor necrosis factor receptor superfamily member 16-like protein [Lates japonicus]|uniref:Tumor necrosis factor receptor superfamily member 16-like protein n=1 Tax=Lates japonicus TaxID=270547 RepID=A0AAD3NFX4_LATJO|nr:tumor necrosis factor receptor superfamily member 16-like protein [Lates japonicus]
MGPSPSSFTYFLPDGSNSPMPGGETTTSSAGSPRFLGHGLNENLIPIYCSILAAVVVGLVAYIVFKRPERANSDSNGGLVGGVRLTDVAPGYKMAGRWRAKYPGLPWSKRF